MEILIDRNKSGDKAWLIYKFGKKYYTAAVCETYPSDSTPVVHAKLNQKRKKDLKQKLKNKRNFIYSRNYLKRLHETLKP